MSLALLEEYHASHDCNPGKCICECGCQVEIWCTVWCGGMCSVCSIREMRDEGDGPHRRPVPQSAHQSDSALR
jgi:hypothetical protein